MRELREDDVHIKKDRAQNEALWKSASEGSEGERCGEMETAYYAG